MDSLKRRAVRLSQQLNELDGVSCNAIDGAMYAFPTITLPPNAVAAAKSQGIEADEFYCLELLEETGIVIVPGSGFKQVEGTFHFRTTILPGITITIIIINIIIITINMIIIINIR